MTGRLDGRSAVITGGGSGIGRATALRFAQEGASVLAVDQDAEGAAETCRQIEAAGGQAEAFEADVTDSESARRGVSAALDAFGAVDVLMTAAGISVGRSVVDTEPCNCPIAEPYSFAPVELSGLPI